MFIWAALIADMHLIGDKLGWEAEGVNPRCWKLKHKMAGILSSQQFKNLKSEEVTKQQSTITDAESNQKNIFQDSFKTVRLE